MPSILDSVKDALSANRVGTYEQAKGLTKPGLVVPLSLDKALELYAWNAQISAAFMHPLHICEVVVRNGVANAIEAVYGANWPWSAAFLRSLPNPTVGYNPRRDLLSARNGQVTAGKVIPELKFVFWQRMFTSRHDSRLWMPLMGLFFPNSPAATPIEPIFARNLGDDFNVVCELISRRCPNTATWMKAHQHVTSLLSAPPV